MTLLSDYDVVWVNPGLTSSNFTTLQGGVAALGSLEQYAFGGGVLVLNVASSPTNLGLVSNVGPGGVDYNSGGIDNSETFASPSHPYLTGAGFGGASLIPGNFNNWSATDHGWFENLVSGTTTILQNTSSGTPPTFVEYGYGSGTVILNSLTFGYGSLGATADPLNNLINYSVFASQDAASVPEPSTFAILCVGAGLTIVRCLRKRHAA
ncbi:MAG: PEP-CTERM sorting domain-containing protein [Planctomycetaceae bacterium]